MHEGKTIQVEKRRRVAGVLAEPRSALARSTSLSEVLQSNEAKIRLQAVALERAANAILITDVAGTILWANNACAELTGYSVEELLGQNPRIIKSGQHDARFYKALWDTLLSGRTFQAEFINRRKDGGLYFTESTITPVRSDTGEITHFVGIMSDVTQRKRVEQELRSAHEKLSQLLTHGPAVIYKLKVDGCKLTPVMVSDNIVRLLGVSPSYAMRYSWWLENLHPEDRDRVLAGVADGLARGAYSMEYRIRHRDGTYRWVEDNNRVVHDSAGRPREALGIWADVTARKLAEERLRESELKKNNLEVQFLRAQRVETIGRLASGVAHDLNNILAPIMMLAPLLRAGLSPEDAEKAGIQIENSAERGAQVVRQLLTLARGMEGQRGPVQPGLLLKEMGRMMTETFPRNIIIEQNFSDDLWTIIADATQLHQVLLNLCVNARDAMPNGGRLTLVAENIDLTKGSRPSPEVKPGLYVLIQVRDNGIGIPSHVMEHLFEPFFTTKGPMKGTGLGLATVHGIVRGHEGFVEVESTAGKGATFKVYIPANPGAKTMRGGGKRQEAPKGHRETILIVDDEEPLRRIMSETLESANYKVITAADGAEALIVFSRLNSEIQAVVCDLMMPVFDGLGTVRVLRKMNPQVKILVSSALIDDPDQNEKIAQLRALGVQSFLSKPYTQDQLLEAVHRTLSEDTVSRI